MEKRSCSPSAACDLCEIFGPDVIPPGKIMQISVSVFRAGQSCPVHTHPDMTEVFIGEKGNIDITVNDETVHLGAGDTVLVRPGSSHSLINATDHDCELLVMGVAS